ncbi:MAG: response regulator [Candidatus Desulfacyla sp.]
MLQAALPKDVAFKTDLTTSGTSVRGNPNEIQQVLTSLFTNALEAVTEKGGAVFMELKAVPAAEVPTENRFPVDWKPQNLAYACLEVRDDGRPGIPEKDMAKLFDPFFSTKFAGRGLGLAVVLGIVRAHGGCIAVESRCGAGSVFRVFLPLTAEVVRRPKEAAIRSPETKGGGTVLLIEDTDQVRQLGVRMLKYLGWQVLSARDGREGVEIFRERSEKIDWVLSDLSMPRMDGWKTIAALRQIRPDIPVILASGYDEAGVMSGDHAEQPQVFLGKPYSLEDLREAIEELGNK